MPAQTPGTGRSVQPAPGTRGHARAAGAKDRREARPGNEWTDRRGGAADRQHSLMKTLYSRVKGTARSSLLKPLMVPETSHRRCYRATSPHAAPTDKTLSRLRTLDLRAVPGAPFNTAGARGPAPPTLRPPRAQAHSVCYARRRVQPCPLGPILHKPATIQAAPRRWHLPSSLVARALVL